MATWPAARYYTAANNGPGTQTELNAIQDQFYRAAGITQTDLASTVLATGWGSDNSKLLAVDSLLMSTSATGTAVVYSMGSASVTIAAGDLVSFSMITDAGIVAGTPTLVVEILVDGVAVTYPYMSTSNTYQSPTTGFAMTGWCYAYGNGPGGYGNPGPCGVDTSVAASSIPILTQSSYMCIPNISAGARTLSARITISGFPTVGISSATLSRFRCHFKIETY